MSLNSTQKAMRINNAGVDDFGQGHICESMAQFRESLFIVKGLLQQNENAQASKPNHQAFCNVHLEEPSSSEHTDNGKADEAGILNRPIRFKIAEDTPNITEPMASVLVAVVLFNEALTLQWFRKSMGKDMTFQACSLYGMCLQCLTNVPVSRASTQIAIVALNNIAKIHFEYARYKECETCLSHAYALLRSSPSPSLLPADCTCVALNLFTLRRPTSAEAA